MSNKNRKPFGRAAFIALYAISAGTIVMTIATIALFNGVLPPETWGTVAGSYMVMIGIVGAVAHGPNITERLPGTRRWEKLNDPILEEK